MSVEVFVKSGKTELAHETFLCRDDASELLKATVLWLCLKAYPSCGVTWADVNQEVDRKSSRSKCYFIDKIKEARLDLTIDESQHIIDIGEKPDPKIEELAKNILDDVHTATVGAKAKEGARETSLFDGDVFEATFMPNR